MLRYYFILQKIIALNLCSAQKLPRTLGAANSKLRANIFEKMRLIYSEDFFMLCKPLFIRLPEHRKRFRCIKAYFDDFNCAINCKLFAVCARLFNRNFNQTFYSNIASINSCALKGRKSSILSPTPIKRIGIGRACAMAAMTPPLAVPSSLLNTKPVTPSASSKILT